MDQVCAREEIVAGKVGRGGRPAFAPTEEQRRNVEIMSGLGIPQEDICLMVRDKNGQPISIPTLEKHFRKELDQGAIKINARVGNFMIANILGMPVPEGVTPITNKNARAAFAQLFARARMGWKETAVNEHANADGKPFVFQVSKTDAKL